MTINARFGAVIFAADHKKVADFYASVANLSVQLADATVVVLRSGAYELVIHKLSGEPAPGDAAVPREDTYIKPFLPVATLASAREKAAEFGGRLEPADKEWRARGFRACEAVDPEGNVIQFREEAP